VSTDLVSWQDAGINLWARNETYKGMTSDSSPCSGFVAVNDDGRVCAGFRQCDSTHGTTGLNPAAQPWDAPLEYRCATDESLTAFGASEFLFPVYYYRSLPYDPVRPWRDLDGKLYVALATDGCNATTRTKPCVAGGRLDLWKADRSSGPWTQMAPMFTTNITMSGGVRHIGSVNAEFVTPDYFGGLPGDPDGGATRVVTQNPAHSPVCPPFGSCMVFWVGRQSNGSTFEPYWSVPGAVGHYDYGSLTMARTLGSSDANQVAVPGRRILIGSIGHPAAGASQSLPRDLSLSPSRELLQRFVPELQALRMAGSYRHLASRYASRQPPMFAASRELASSSSMQFEIWGRFSLDCAKLPQASFGIDVYCAAGTCTRLQIECTTASESAAIAVPARASCTVGVNTTAQFDPDHNRSVASGPLLPLLPSAGAYEIVVHAIVDHAIIEVVFNNRTAIGGMYTKPPEATTYATRVFGDVEAEVDYWELEAPSSIASMKG